MHFNLFFLLLIELIEDVRQPALPVTRHLDSGNQQPITAVRRVYLLLRDATNHSCLFCMLS